MRQYENRKLSHTAYGKRIQRVRSEIRNMRSEEGRTARSWGLTPERGFPTAALTDILAGPFLMVGGSSVPCGMFGCILGF